jgi:LacI family transcriptional regulator
MSLIGFDDIEFSQCTQPPLTTIRLSPAEVGVSAFDVLYRNLIGQSVHGEEIKVSTTLVLRQSTAVVSGS